MASLTRLRAACVTHPLTQLIRVCLCGNREHAESHPPGGGLAINWLGRTSDLDATTFELGCGLILNQHLPGEAIKLVDQNDIKQFAPSIGQELLERHALR